MEDKVNVKFRLVSIDNEHYTSNFEGIVLNSIPEDRLKFQYKIETIIQMSKGNILVIPSIRYSYENHELLVASAVFTYSVLNLDNAIIVDKENQRINVKADFFPSLVGAAYSTLRGIVYARTSGTPLAKYPLPMIEVKTLVEKNGISVEE
ncbi:MAG: hypothetical protein PUC72_04435 [Bacteroidales bacterium]|nr:hypothetical protein [Bacteroidales bacterium]